MINFQAYILDVAYVICAGYLFSIMFLSGFTKILQLKKEDANQINGNKQKLNSFGNFFEGSVFGVLEIGISSVFILCTNSTVVFACAFVICLAIAGILSEQYLGMKLCNCFGSITPKNRKWLSTIRVLIILSAFIIISLFYFFKWTFLIKLNVVLLFLILAITFAFTLKILHSEIVNSLTVIKKTDAPYQSDQSLHRHLFQPDQFIGNRSEKPFYLSDISIGNSIVFFCFLSQTKGSKQRGQVLNYKVL